MDKFVQAASEEAGRVAVLLGADWEVVGTATVKHVSGDVSLSVWTLRLSYAVPSGRSRFTVEDVDAQCTTEELVALATNALAKVRM